MRIFPELAPAAAAIGRLRDDSLPEEFAEFDRVVVDDIPAAVWTYKLGGYQVLKKWLWYRERDVLKRALTPQEVQRFTDVARRIAAMLTLPLTTLNVSSWNDLVGIRS